ncbi:MAG: Wadjet anti-phage system protein JetD domain-containing protein [Limisphaerales bacterium]
MSPLSPVFGVLARRYERSQVGRTGLGSRDVQVEFESALAEAGCKDGDSREMAERQLRELDGQLLSLEFAHKRDRSNIFRVRLSFAHEAAFYNLLGRRSPFEHRSELAKQFQCAANDNAVPPEWQPGWKRFFESLAAEAAIGGSIQPFERHHLASNAELLNLLPQLLNWKNESLIRFASCVLCNDSKRLESLASLEREGELQGRHRGKLGLLLEKVTNGTIRSLEDLGIVANPRSVLLHGPIRFLFGGQWLDLGLFRGAFWISLQDIQRAERIECSARRCLTVENETSFHELVKLGSGELLIQTSYPGSATLELLRKLPEALAYWHFGDSDEAGFEILRVLREKSGRPFQPLHMQEGRKPFEQESLGLPNREWPFYTL